MQINYSKKIDPLALPVIALANDKKVNSHPFYKSLDEDDKILLDRFLEKTSFDNPVAHTVFLPSGNRILLLGLGDKRNLNLRKTILAMRRLVGVAKKDKVKNLSVNLADFMAAGVRDLDFLAETAATQFELANFEYTHYKTPPKDGWSVVENINIHEEKNVSKALARGKIIGEEINKTRELSNTPGGDMTPQALAEAAIGSAKNLGIKVNVLDEKEMQKLGMGGILAVGKGSDNPPRLIVVEYMQGPKKQAPVVLVGKGITFDSGGLNLKPSQAIYEMHMDMSGGAAVIHTIATLARLGVKRNIVGLIAAAENMPSGRSYRPGDVLKTMNGKTIEVLNTDAEGRVVMSDALEYSKKYNPRLVIDVATLTGAAIAALGQRATAMFTTDKKLENSLRDLGEKTLDYVWPLPLWEEYEDEVRGTFGDWANIGRMKPDGGAITGAVFLWQFIKPIPWVHLDIAPRMTTIDSDNLAKGAAGAPVNLLVHFLEKF